LLDGLLVIDWLAVRTFRHHSSLDSASRLRRTLRAYERLARWRDRAAGPLAQMLVRLRVSADQVSVMSVLLMVPMVFLARDSPWPAAACCLSSVAADQLDGAVARRTETSCDRGKLVDMICDNLAFTVYTLALVVGGLLAPATGMLLVYFMVSSKILRSLVHAEFLRSDWFFRPVAGFLPNAAAAVLYLAFLPYAVSGAAPFEVVGMVLAATLAADSAVHLARLLRRPPAEAGSWRPSEKRPMPPIAPSRERREASVRWQRRDLG
jgi:phosphatidylglycerophosphate synthase